MNFLIIKNYEKKPVGILIHITKNIITTTKLFAYILNEKKDNTISDNFWISRKYSDKLKDIKWSLNYLKEDIYNTKPLPPKESLDRKKKIEKEIYKEKNFIVVLKNM